MRTTSTPEPPDVPRLRGWRAWIEPWYLAYALLGATVAGLLPIVLPLFASRAGNSAYVMKGNEKMLGILNLVQEEAHIDWLETQIEQINQMGLENYLTNQAR